MQAEGCTWETSVSLPSSMNLQMATRTSMWTVSERANERDPWLLTPVARALAAASSAPAELTWMKKRWMNGA